MSRDPFCICERIVQLLQREWVGEGLGDPVPLGRGCCVHWEVEDWADIDRLICLK
jgi:hypothetical protein